MSFAIHGYHPYAEDGGLYAAGIKWLLNPALYPHSQAFVGAHLHYSMFAPAVAAMVRITHLNLPTVLIGIYLMCTAATLAGVWSLARRCVENPMAQLGAVALTAAWLTVPVAGTSLILQDPYVTARSISGPCTLFALVATLDFFLSASSLTKRRSAFFCFVSLLAAALAHPLMAAYAFGDVLLLATLLSSRQTIRRWGTASLCLLAFLLAAMLQALSRPDAPAYVEVARTRYYWFLSAWHWYEIAGLVAPLSILGVFAFAPRSRLKLDEPSTAVTARRALARMALFSGGTAVLIALCFAHENSTAYVVARLQPLRTFQTIYLLMILALGVTVGEYLLLRSTWRWITLFSLLSAVMFYVQRSTYPSSAHIEWPTLAPQNQWQEAFLWIRHNTPTSSLFAMDAHYISEPGEDAQSFRAIAERSALPDYSKDGGEASITPLLATEWKRSQLAQAQLSTQSDSERLAALHPFNADWVVLQQHAQTALTCPYQNDFVKVCKLP